MISNKDECNIKSLTKHLPSEKRTSFAFSFFLRNQVLIQDAISHDFALPGVSVRLGACYRGM